MKRAELEALGLSKEQVDEVIKINGADIENAKSVAKAEAESIQTENEALKGQVKDRDKQIDDLKKSVGDNDELKKQIEQLQADNKAKDDAHKAEIFNMKVDSAVEKALSDAGALAIKAVRPYLDLTDAKFADDGTVKGLKEQIDALKNADDTKFLFKAPDQNGGQTQFTGFQPGSATTVPDSKQAGYEARLAEARKNNNQLEVIKIKQEAFNDGGLVLM